MDEFNNRGACRRRTAPRGRSASLRLLRGQQALHLGGVINACVSLQPFSPFVMTT
jgi:hypothetical protein